MRAAFPANRHTLHKLWAWRRAGRTTLGELLMVEWRTAQANDRSAWVVSEPIDAGDADSDVRQTLGQLHGVDWHSCSGNDDAASAMPFSRLVAGDADDAQGGSLQLSLTGEPLPLDAFLLLLPADHEPTRPRDVVVVVRGRSIAQQVVEDLCTVADTTVLEGARCAAGMAGPWATAGLQHQLANADGEDDWWFRIPDPPYFLLRRWLDSANLGFGADTVRIYRLTPPVSPGRPHLWVLWGYEPALVSDQDFDASDAADQLILVSPCEPLHLVPSNAFGPLAERILPLEQDPDAGDYHPAPDGSEPELRPDPIVVPLRMRPRSYISGGRMWRLPERRLRQNVGWLERLPEAARRNLLFVACKDSAGEAILYLTEQVRGKTVMELGTIAEPLAEVPGLNCYLAPGFHLVPEVSAETLRHLIYRADNVTDMAAAWGAAAPAGSSALADLVNEPTLPMAIIEPESSDGAVQLAVDLRASDDANDNSEPGADRTARKGTTRRRLRESAAVADPWGVADVDDQVERAPVRADAVTWRVWFLSSSAFRPFDELGSLLLRDAHDSLHAWQESVQVVLPPDPVEPTG